MLIYGTLIKIEESQYIIHNNNNDNDIIYVFQGDETLYKEYINKTIYVIFNHIIEYNIVKETKSMVSIMQAIYNLSHEKNMPIFNFTNIKYYKIKSIYIFEKNILNNNIKMYAISNYLICNENIISEKNINIIEKKYSIENYIKFIFYYLNYYEIFQDLYIKNNSDISFQLIEKFIDTINNKIIKENYININKDILEIINENKNIYKVHLFNLIILNPIIIFKSKNINEYLRLLEIINELYNLNMNISKYINIAILTYSYNNVVNFEKNKIKNNCVKKEDLVNAIINITKNIKNYQNNLDNIMIYYNIIFNTVNNILYFKWQYFLLNKLLYTLKSYQNNDLNIDEIIKDNQFCVIKKNNILCNLLYNNILAINKNLDINTEDIIKDIQVLHDKENILLLTNNYNEYQKNNKIEISSIEKELLANNIYDKQYILIIDNADNIDIYKLYYVINENKINIKKIIFIFDSGKNIKNFMELYSIIPAIYLYNNKEINMIKNINNNLLYKHYIYNIMLDESNKMFNINLYNDETQNNNIVDYFQNIFNKLLIDILQNICSLNINNIEYLNGYKEKISINDILIKYFRDFKIITINEKMKNADNYCISSSNFINKMIIYYLLGIRLTSNNYYIPQKTEIDIEKYINGNNILFKTSLNNYKIDKDINELRSNLILNNLQDLFMIKDIPYIINNNSFLEFNLNKYDIVTLIDYDEQNKIFNFQKDNQIYNIPLNYVNIDNINYAFAIPEFKLKEKYNNLIYILLGEIGENKKTLFNNYNLGNIYKIMNYKTDKLILYVGKQFIELYDEHNFKYDVYDTIVYDLLKAKNVK